MRQRKLLTILQLTAIGFLVVVEDPYLVHLFW